MKSETVRLDDASQEAAMDSQSGQLPKWDRLIQGVRALEQWYAADFEKRIAAVLPLLESQIRQELREELTADLSAQTELMRQKYEESVYAQFSKWDVQRQLLEKEIAELRKKAPGNELVDEIASTEKMLAASTDKASQEVEQLMPDAASVSRMLEARVDEMVLKAYLRGLKFRLEEK